MADHRHIWISPAVLNLGGMRDLTLLQGSEAVCCCLDDPDCEF